MDKGVVYGLELHVHREGGEHDDNGTHDERRFHVLEKRRGANSGTEAKEQAQKTNKRKSRNKANKSHIIILVHTSQKQAGKSARTHARKPCPFIAPKALGHQSFRNRDIDTSQRGEAESDG